MRTPSSPGSTAFGRLFAASAGSNLGDGIALAAFPLIAAGLSDSPIGVAGITIAGTLPWLLFGLPAGVVVDRMDQIRLMWTVDAVRGTATAALGLALLLETADLGHLYATIFLLGVAETLFDTAAMSVIPALVPAGDLERANGRLFAAQLTANQFVGPPLGGLLFAAASAAPILADSATFLVSALILLRVRPVAEPATSSAPRGRFLTDLWEGLRWVWQERDIRWMAVGAGAINLAYTGAMAILVLYAQDHLGIGGLGFGLLFTGAAVGALVGSLGTARVVASIGRRRALLVGVGAMGAAWLVIGLTRSAVLTAACLGLAGLGAELWNVVAVTYRQIATPARLRGRVMSAYRFIAYSTFPTGAALGGWLAGVTSVRAPFLAGGALIATLVAFLAALLGDLERSEPPAAH